jgi:small subunit ribosomal protein S9
MPVKKSVKKEVKKVPEKPVQDAPKSVSGKEKPAEKYFRGIGRRKLSIAGAKLFVSSLKAANQEILINKKNYKEYFPLAELQDIVAAPLKAVSVSQIGKITIAVRGGGMRGQAEASRLGIARALVLIDESFKKTLRDLGYLTRDARVVERKKPGLKKARRAPQFSKR